MESYTTLSQAITALQQQGYDHDFNLETNCLSCGKKNTSYPAEAFIVDKFFRFEGMTDPDDSSVLYAITASDGTKGLLVDAYGVYASSISDEMLRKLIIH